MRREHPVLTVAKREYLTRVRTKGFWIGTVLIPILMGAWLILPGFLASRTTAGQELAVVDATGDGIGNALAAALEEKQQEENNPVRFSVEVIEPAGVEADTLRAQLDERVLDEDIRAWLWIDDTGLAEDEIEYHAENVSNWLTQEVLEDSLSDVLREARLTEAGYDTTQIAELSRSVDLATTRISETGSREGGGAASFALAFGLFFTLYLTIIIYGQQVLQGVLEEKSSRIVEVVLSAVKPAQLMGGKLVGICLLGLTQLAIWMTTLFIFSAPGIAGALALAPENVPEVPLMVVVHFFLHFLLGYFLYASFFAMIGSAFNDLQEAQQLSSFAMIFLVAPVMFLLPVINDPNAPLAVVTSLIPPMTPLLMPLRIALEMPPLWQIGLGYLLGILFTSAVVWMAGRVYRVGILMHGKKPTIQEIWKWARY